MSYTPKEEYVVIDGLQVERLLCRYLFKTGELSAKDRSTFTLHMADRPKFVIIVKTLVNTTEETENA